MSDTTFRLARLGEDAAIIDFINANFDMRLPLLNRPELYHHYYAGRGGVPQFAVAEQDGEYVSAAGYILANTKRRPDIWVSVWVAAKSHNGVGLELMNALPGLLNADVVACNNIRPNTCTFYQFLGWKAERLPHYYRLGRRRAYYLAKPLRYSLRRSRRVPERRRGDAGQRTGCRSCRGGSFAFRPRRCCTSARHGDFR